ncbi:MAG: hypothetical protein EXS69_02200 [Candidatus Zambryskibacteria bacterium]|nr:hypothetical protein [Candidatus Zambryskibacteria bacterium]
MEIVFSAWLLLALIDTEYRPKKSLVLYVVLTFLAVVGLADLLGVDPVKSLWSNFERMEGFIALLHLGAFFLVISSTFKESDWNKWWNTSLVASGLMVLYCLLQIFGLKTINQGGVRVDGTLGNAIYLSVYMLFHIFVALLFLYRGRKNVALRWVYGLLILAQTFILYYTATRGAIIGLIGGLLVAAILNIRNVEDSSVRKTSVAVLFGLVILLGSFALFRGADFVKSSPVLSRFSSLTTSEIKTQGRYFVWPMAVDGLKEHPILGWGQENFIYVFQKYYRPEMYQLEPWFDRAHNIFLDWAIAGGLLGLLAYLALYGAMLLSLWKREQDLPHAERAILTGLLSAYAFHSFFVFDHLASYILFFALLAYLHHRSSGEIWGARIVSEIQVRFVAYPAVAILLLASLYFVNIKPIMTNVFLIEAFKAVQTPGQGSRAILYFEKAYQVSTLGRPEVVEHLIRNSVPIFQSDIPVSDKNRFFAFAKEVVVREAEHLPNNTRYQLLAGSFFSTTSLFNDALHFLTRAKESMPNKQQIYFELGALYINMSDRQKALESFKDAYDLAPVYDEAKIIYLVGAIYAGDYSLESKLKSELSAEVIANDPRIASAYKVVGR